MEATMHPAAARYLKDLERELVDLPGPQRREVLTDIRDHIEEAAAERDDEADIRTILDELGDPGSIASEARQRFGITRRRGGPLEAAAVVLLPIGGLVIPLLGWIAGVVLLWISPVWSVRDKLIGTLVVPGGLLLPAFLGMFGAGPEACTMAPGGRGSEAVTMCSKEPLTSSAVGIVVLVVLVLAPIGTAIYLGRRAWRSHDA